MLKYFVILIFLFFHTFSYASVTSKNLSSFDALNDAQKAQILAQIAKMKEEQPVNPTFAAPIAKEVRSEVQAWAEIGANLGRSLASTAKELGVAANDFVKTPVGIATAGIILYKLVGRDILHITFGFLFLVSYFTAWFYLFRRISLMRTMTITQDIPEGLKLTKKTKKIEYRGWDNLRCEEVWMWFLTAAGGLIAGTIITFT
jgi:hypothetical protein